MLLSRLYWLNTHTVFIPSHPNTYFKYSIAARHKIAIYFSYHDTMILPFHSKPNSPYCDHLSSKFISKHYPKLEKHKIYVSCNFLVNLQDHESKNNISKKLFIDPKTKHINILTLRIQAD